MATLHDAIAAVRAVRAAAARGDRLGAVNAYLKACNAIGDSFGRAPATSRSRVYQAVLAVKPLVFPAIGSISHASPA